MKKILVFCWAILLSATNITADNIDSLANVALTYAAHNDVTALRPIYKKINGKVPNHVQLYCEMTIARNEGRYDRMIECIDSLRVWYPKQIKKNTLISLAELKAEGLRKNGDYRLLYEYCKEEIKFFKKKKYKSEQLKELTHFLKIASRLLGTSPRSQLLQLADRKLPIELDSLYNIYREHVDDFTQKRCEVLLSHAFNQTDELINSSQYLVEYYVDSLDNEDLSYCIKLHAEALIQEGKWKDLANWIDYTRSIDRKNSISTSLYSKIAKELIDKPALKVNSGPNDCIVSTTYEWPLLLPLKVNNSVNYNFTISTEQPFTYISEKIAVENKVKVIEDTTYISTANGILEVSPGWVNSFTLGNINIQNSFVYIVHKSNRVPTPFDCSIGMNLLTALKHITFFREKIVIPCIKSQQKGRNITKALYLSPNKGLRVLARNEDGKQPLSFNFSYPNNVFSNKCTSVLNEVESLPIIIGEQKYDINKPVYVDTKAEDFNGVLGLPFLRHYQKIDLDLANMSISAQGPTIYEPTRSKFDHNTDKHYLRRNYSALTAGYLLDNEENKFLQLLLAIGNNRPDEVANISNTLKSKSSDFYDVYTDAESLFLCGKYAQAITLLDKEYTKISDDATKHDKDLEEYRNLCHLFQKEQPLSIEGSLEEIEYKLGDAEISVLRINNKKVKGNIDLFKQQTVMDIKTANKLKVKILGKLNNRSYGIISELLVGNISIKNVPCTILHDKADIEKELPNHGKGLTLGWDVLRHFAQITFTPSHLILSVRDITKTKDFARLYYNNSLFVETESLSSFPTYKIIKNGENVGISQNLKISHLQCPAADITAAKISDGEMVKGSIALNYLISRSGQVTFNLKEMKLSMK